MGGGRYVPTPGLEIRSNRPGQKGLSFALQLIAANNWPDLLSAKMPRIQPRAVFGDKSPIVTKAHLSQSENIFGEYSKFQSNSRPLHCRQTLSSKINKLGFNETGQIYLKLMVVYL